MRQTQSTFAQIGTRSLIILHRLQSLTTSIGTLSSLTHSNCTASTEHLFKYQNQRFSSYCVQINDDTAEAMHYGRRSLFRGFIPFLTRSALLTTAVKVPNYVLSSRDELGIEKMISLGVGLLGYIVLYPIEMINMRMCSEIEKQRFYGNVRECVSKIKKNQGIKTLYRGFFYGSILFASQLMIVDTGKRIIDKMANFNDWQKAGLLLSFVGIAEVLLYPFITVKYNPDLFRKLYQVNGALGHTDRNFSIKTTFHSVRGLELFKGLSTRFTNFALYGIFYSVWLSGDRVDDI